MVGKKESQYKVAKFYIFKDIKSNITSHVYHYYFIEVEDILTLKSVNDIILK